MNLGAPILEYTVVVVAADGTVQSVRTVEEQKLHPAIMAMIILAALAFMTTMILWIVYQRWVRRRRIQETSIAMHTQLKQNPTSEENEQKISPRNSDRVIRTAREDNLNNPLEGVRVDEVEYFKEDQHDEF